MLATLLRKPEHVGSAPEPQEFRSMASLLYSRSSLSHEPTNIMEHSMKHPGTPRNTQEHSGNGSGKRVRLAEPGDAALGSAAGAEAPRHGIM